MKIRDRFVHPDSGVQNDPPCWKTWSIGPRRVASGRSQALLPGKALLEGGYAIRSVSQSSQASVVLIDGAAPGSRADSPVGAAGWAARAVRAS
jgi:hypothetical protein